MTEQPPDPAYTPMCATCRHPGRPKTVSISKGQRIITYRCDACGAEWTDVETDTEPILSFRQDIG